ncbi:zinc-binding dehydrogenase [Streptomyces sp. NPDC054796]
MIGTGRTVMGVVEGHEPGPGDTVLVLSAAGGMGALLTQYARHRGARVVGAAGGAEKAAIVRDLGADLALDYGRPDWAGRVRAELRDERPVSHLFDGVGGSLGHAALDLVAPGGTAFTYGSSSTVFSASAASAASEPPGEAGEDRGITIVPLEGRKMLERRRALEERALAYAGRGVLVPLVRTFPLDETAAAHHALQNRGTVGKVVLLPWGRRSAT